jgi:hypothetical protein
MAPHERTWFGAVPITSVERTLNDCAIAGLSPELLRQAAVQALEQRLRATAAKGTDRVQGESSEPVLVLIEGRAEHSLSDGARSASSTAPATDVGAEGTESGWIGVCGVVGTCRCPQ